MSLAATVVVFLLAWCVVATICTGLLVLLLNVLIVRCRSAPPVMVPPAYLRRTLRSNRKRYPRGWQHARSR